MSPEPGVAKSVEIAVPMSDVWRMLTEPEQIVKWMGGARVESQWEIEVASRSPARCPTSTRPIGIVAQCSL